MLSVIVLATALVILGMVTPSGSSDLISKGKYFHFTYFYVMFMDVERDLEGFPV